MLKRRTNKDILTHFTKAKDMEERRPFCLNLFCVAFQQETMPLFVGKVLAGTS